MPGHKLKEDQVKNKSLFARYRCPRCLLTLRDAVQLQCGHWLCESCMLPLFQVDAPECPRCGESLKDNDSDNPWDQCIFPDKCVQREIKNLHISCEHLARGCTWEGKLRDHDEHLKDCQFLVKECSKCGEVMDDHHQCPEGQTRCPFVGLVCECKKKMKQESDIGNVQGLFWKQLEKTLAKTIEQLNLKQQLPVAMNIYSRSASSCGCDESDGSQEKGYHDSHRFQQVSAANKDAGDKITSIQDESWRSDIGVFGSCGECGESSSLDCGDVMMPKEEASNFFAKAEMVINEKMSKTEDAAEIQEIKVMLINLKQRITKLEKKQEKLLMVPKCNPTMECSHNGRLHWNISDINRLLKDAYRGSISSIDSFPFYTSSRGYKMCLRLYLLGDGTGKCTHMSLFFVVMRGEFDDTLKWPFENKVTFILINPSHEQNVVDTFWPDPSSSSFKKPESEMNIASGCPQFLLLLDLMKFVLDDSITIRCIVEKKRND